MYVHEHLHWPEWIKDHLLLNIFNNCGRGILMKNAEFKTAMYIGEKNNNYYHF